MLCKSRADICAIPAPAGLKLENHEVVMPIRVELILPDGFKKIMKQQPPNYSSY